MNDNELKKFLKENQKIPSRSGQEWSGILHKIEKEKSSKFSWSEFGIKKFSLGFASFAVLLIIAVNISKPNDVVYKQVRLEQIDSFLASDSYFNEVEEELSWVSGI